MRKFNMILKILEQIGLKREELQIMKYILAKILVLIKHLHDSIIIKYSMDKALNSMSQDQANTQSVKT
jgi:hypothetical protein